MFSVSMDYVNTIQLIEEITPARVAEIQKIIRFDLFKQIISTYNLSISIFDYNKFVTTATTPSRHIKIVNAMRWNYVTCLSNILTRYCAPFCQFGIYGSKDATSDIDVSLENIPGEHIPEFIQTLSNQVFENTVDLNKLLDTNFYLSTWFECVTPNILPLDKVNIPVLLWSPQTQVRQLAWALYHLQEAVNTYAVFQSFFSDKIQATRVWKETTVLREEINDYKTNNVKVSTLAKKRNALLRRISKNLNARRQTLELVSIDASGNTTSVDLDDDTVDTTGPYSVHIKKLISESATQQIPSTKVLERLMDDLYNTTSHIARIEPETYFTMGAFRHVVLNLQRNQPTPLNSIEYACSFLENVAFMLEHFSTNHCEEVTKKIAKYIWRAFNALDQITGTFSDCGAAAANYTGAQAFADIQRRCGFTNCDNVMNVMRQHVDEVLKQVEPATVFDFDGGRGRRRGRTKPRRQ